MTCVYIYLLFTDTVRFSFGTEGGRQALQVKYIQINVYVAPYIALVYMYTCVIKEYLFTVTVRFTVRFPFCAGVLLRETGAAGEIHTEKCVCISLYSSIASSHIYIRAYT